MTERPLEDGWLPDTPVDDTLLRRFVHNQAQINAIVARALGGRAAGTDDVFLADAASAVPYFNQAILARPLREAGDGVLDEVESFYAAGKSVATLLSIWPTPDLSARGWSLMGHPAFVARGPVPRSVPLRDGVEVRVAGDAGDLAVAERVAIEGYPMPEAGGEPGALLPPALLETGVRVRLGLCDGEPSAVGNSYVGLGVVNLCLGATLPAARRRGVWEALVWARVNDAPDQPAVAYTSDHSRPGFIRMGFLPITRFTLWARSPAG
ncbi:MAG: hypothetical protein ACRDYV_03650 [Acidimicrobiia bacterium]